MFLKVTYALHIRIRGFPMNACLFFPRNARLHLFSSNYARFFSSFIKKSFPQPDKAHLLVPVHHVDTDFFSFKHIKLFKKCLEDLS